MGDIFQTSCPSCGSTRKATTEHIGRQVRCPCGDTFVIRDPGEVEFEQFVPPLPVAAPMDVSASQRARMARGRLRTMAAAAFVLGGLMSAVMFLRQSDGELVSTTPAIDALTELVQGDEAHASVSQWLDENTRSGEWEQIRWEPARPVEGHNARVCRMKFRTANAFGGQSVSDQYFISMRGGEWEPLVVPSRLTNDEVDYDVLKRLHDFLAAIDPDLVDQIDAHGLQRDITRVILRRIKREAAGQ